MDPITTPPVRLFGTPGISLPICHCTELIPDFLELPVPTTSPTYASGCPFSLSFAIVSRGFSIRATNIELACSGISALVNASEAGERSSVFVSPGTLYTVTVISSASGSLEVNHSAFAQDSITSLAYLLP